MKHHPFDLTQDEFEKLRNASAKTPIAKWAKKLLATIASPEARYRVPAEKLPPRAISR